MKTFYRFKIKIIEWYKIKNFDIYYNLYAGTPAEKSFGRCFWKSVIEKSNFFFKLGILTILFLNININITKLTLKLNY